MTLKLEELTGWDQPKRTLDEVVQLQQKCFARYPNRDPKAPHDCENCGGWGFIPIECDYGLEIECCDSCGRFKGDLDAIEYHRQVCGCDYPEHAPRDTELDILLKKKLALQDLKCPNCGNDSSAEPIYLWTPVSLRLQGRTLAPDPIAGAELHPNTRLTCDHCNFRGRVSDFSPSSKE